MFHLPLSLLVILTLCSHSQSHRDVPLLTGRRTLRLPSPTFTDGGSADHEPMCGIECQRNLPEPGTLDLERLLAYETFYENGTRTLTEVELQDVRNASLSSPHAVCSRRKRQVYGTDGRFVITDKRFVTNFPFSASVKLSTGCSGILVSPKHVLTAAHCVHDGQGYRRGLKGLRVGVMKLQRKAGRRRNRMERESKRSKRKGKRRRNRRQRKMFKQHSEQPVLRWTRVKQTYIPRGWMSDVGNDVTLDYDYALLELKRTLQVKHMDVGVVPHATRIHFSSFDHDHTGQLVYRFCPVTQESGDLMYQQCDAQNGSSGAGVYVRLRKMPTDTEGKWSRKVIGVFSGHRSMKEGDGGRTTDYNVAVRITPAKLTQICLWIHGDSKKCTTN